MPSEKDEFVQFSYFGKDLLQISSREKFANRPKFYDNEFLDFGWVIGL